MYIYPGNIDGGQNFIHTDDDDILIEGKIDGASTAKIVSNAGSVTIQGKIDGSSTAEITAAGDVRIGVTGGDGDKKIDGGSFVSLGNKIDGASIVVFQAGTGIDIGNKIDGGSDAQLSTASGTIHIHDKIDGGRTYVRFSPPDSLIVDGGIQDGARVDPEPL